MIQGSHGASGRASSSQRRPDQFHPESTLGALAESGISSRQPHPRRIARKNCTFSAMFIELVDALRCPNPHEESWLVAATGSMQARHIIHGKVGCPVCKAEYPIAYGVVDFRPDTSASVDTPSAAPNEQLAMRLAALLGLSDSQGFAVLLGTWGAQAALLAGIVETPLILVNPPADVAGSPGISVIRCDGPIPLAAGSARAVALDDTYKEGAASAVRVTRTGGRVVGPVSVGIPDGAREIARDDSLWVGERSAPASPLVSLHVRRS